MTIADCPTILELRKDTETLKHLSDLEELVDVPVTRTVSDWLERELVLDANVEAAKRKTREARQEITCPSQK